MQTKYSPALRTFCVDATLLFTKGVHLGGGDPGFTKESLGALKQKGKNTN